MRESVNDRKKTDIMERTRKTLLALALASFCTLPFITTGHAQDAAAVYMEETAELAKKLQNPVAALISVPLQNNFEFNGGPKNDGFRYQLNLHPVVPFSLNEVWNLISRTILPFISQEDMVAKGSSQTGLGDTVQSLFFSPRSPTYGGVIWAVGPVFQLPTATDDFLGEEKWGAGPTALALKQQNGWTYGALFNHVWSFAGDSDRRDVNRTFLQPFVSFTTKTSTTFGLNTETSYDWTGEQWTVPLIGSVSQVLKVGKLPVSLALGAKYYAEAPSGAPEWGLRFSVTLLFPK